MPWFSLSIEMRFGFSKDNYTVDEGSLLEVCVVKDGINDVNVDVDIFTEQFNSSVPNRAIGTSLTPLAVSIDFLFTRCARYCFFHSFRPSLLSFRVKLNSGTQGVNQLNIDVYFISICALQVTSTSLP